MKIMLTAGKFCKKREREEENRKIANELREYSENIAVTNRLLRNFISYQELKRTGLLLTSKEVEAKADALSQNMLDCNLIQNGVIVAGMLEYIKEQIA